MKLPYVGISTCPSISTVSAIVTAVIPGKFNISKFKTSPPKEQARPVICPSKTGCGWRLYETISQSVWKQFYVRGQWLRNEVLEVYIV